MADLEARLAEGSAREQAKMAELTSVGDQLRQAREEGDDARFALTTCVLREVKATRRDIADASLAARDENMRDDVYVVCVRRSACVRSVCSACLSVERVCE